MPQPKLDSTFIVLNAKQDATLMPVTPSIYQELDTNFHHFAGCLLVSEYTFSCDWPSWEMHPNGEATLFLHDHGVERKIELNTHGSFAIIPKGAWHTAKSKRTVRSYSLRPAKAR